MKNIVSGISLVIIIILIIYIISAVQGKTVRRTELENALNNAMETAIEMLQEDEAYAPQSNEELISDLQQAIAIQLNSNFKTFTLNVLSIDYEKGIIRIEGIMTYEYLSGGEGSVSVEKTIVMDVYEENIEDVDLKVSFYVDGGLFRSYTVNYSENCVIPPDPTKAATLIGWKDLSTETIYTTQQLSEIVVERNMNFEAVWE